jgi:hypothetical protein
MQYIPFKLCGYSHFNQKSYGIEVIAYTVCSAFLHLPKRQVQIPYNRHWLYSEKSAIPTLPSCVSLILKYSKVDAATSYFWSSLLGRHHSK